MKRSDQLKFWMMEHARLCIYSLCLLAPNKHPFPSAPGLGLVLRGCICTYYVGLLLLSRWTCLEKIKTTIRGVATIAVLMIY